MINQTNILSYNRPCICWINRIVCWKKKNIYKRTKRAVWLFPFQQMIEKNIQMGVKAFLNRQELSQKSISDSMQHHYRLGPSVQYPGFDFSVFLAFSPQSGNKIGKVNERVLFIREAEWRMVGILEKHVFFFFCWIITRSFHQRSCWLQGRTYFNTWREVLCDLEESISGLL